MNDLIIRQAAIDAVCLNNFHDITLVDGEPYTRGYRDGVLTKENDCIENIMNLYPAQPWHIEPPKESGIYIACTDLGVVGECVYTDDGEWDTDGNYRFPMWCQIVAWMPMPAPYPYKIPKWSKK